MKKSECPRNTRNTRKRDYSFCVLRVFRGLNSEAWMFRVPIMRAFVRMRDRQQVRLLKRLADELQADRQSALRESTRHTDAGQSGEIHTNRVDVAQVEGERIGFLADLEGRNRRSRRDQRIDLLVRV